MCGSDRILYGTIEHIWTEVSAIDEEGAPIEFGRVNSQDVQDDLGFFCRDCEAEWTGYTDHIPQQ